MGISLFQTPCLLFFFSMIAHGYKIFCECFTKGPHSKWGISKISASWFPLKYALIWGMPYYSSSITLHNHCDNKSKLITFLYRLLWRTFFNMHIYRSKVNFTLSKLELHPIIAYMPLYCCWWIYALTRG